MTVKQDELRFLVDVAYRCHEEFRPRRIIQEEDFHMHYKRAWYLLGKWCDKGWYEYGVTLDMGWLTDEGRKQAEKYQRALVDGFMKDLQLLSEKHGIRLKQYNEDISLRMGKHDIGDYVNLEEYNTECYPIRKPVPPVKHERMMYPRSDLAKMSEMLRQSYMKPMLETLNGQSSVFKLFEKGNGPS